MGHRMTFDEFLPQYLEAHADRRTQVVHAFGTVAAVALLTVAAIKRKPQLAAAELAAGYVPAWLSHVVIEGNTPKTFAYPLFSLRGDFVMTYKLLRGELPAT
jgi:hypothetical protein